ncbi:hypothetical protein GCM10010174_37220 [Kutzneria viridogrisea]
MLCQGTPRDMGVQRYDVPSPDGSSAFVPMTWAPVNSPLTDPGGHVVGVLHHVEDVTAVQETLDCVRAADLVGASSVAGEAMRLATHYRRGLGRRDRRTGEPAGSAAAGSAAVTAAGWRCRGGRRRACRARCW